MNETDNIEKLEADARARFHGGAFAEAARLYSEAARLDPGRGDLLVSLAWVQIASGNPQAAIATLKQAEAACEDSPDLHHAAGHALNQLRRYKEAEERFRQCLEIKCDWPDIWTELAVALSKQRKLIEAVLLFKAVVKKRPSATDYGNLGQALLLANRFEEAMDAYETGLRLFGERADLCVGMTKALHGLGRPRDAESWAQRALHVDPNHVEAQALATALSSTKPGGPRRPSGR